MILTTVLYTLMLSTGEPQTCHTVLSFLCSLDLFYLEEHGLKIARTTKRKRETIALANLHS